MNKTAFTIKNSHGEHDIPGSFYGMVLYKFCKGDKYQAGRIFWRARNTKEPIKYIQKGLVLDSETNRRFIMLPTLEEEKASSMDIQNWIDSVIHKISQRQPAKAGSVLKQTLMQIVENME